MSRPDDHSGSTPWRPAGRSSGRGGRRRCFSTDRPGVRARAGSSDGPKAWATTMSNGSGRQGARRWRVDGGAGVRRGATPAPPDPARQRCTGSTPEVIGVVGILGAALRKLHADKFASAILSRRASGHVVASTRSELSLLMTFHNIDYANAYDTWLAAAAHRWSLIFWSLIMRVRLEHHQPFDTLAHRLSSAVRADAGVQTASRQTSLDAHAIALPRHPSSASHGR